MATDKRFRLYYVYQDNKVVVVDTHMPEELSSEMILDNSHTYWQKGSVINAEYIGNYTRADYDIMPIHELLSEWDG